MDIDDVDDWHTHLDIHGLTWRHSALLGGDKSPPEDPVCPKDMKASKKLLAVPIS
jgi:hypothetical protein